MNKQNMNKMRELAKVMRELADLYDEVADMAEKEEVDEQQLENVMGKIFLKSMTIQKLQ